MVISALRRFGRWFVNAFVSPSWIRKVYGWVYSSQPASVHARLRYWYDASFRERSKAASRAYRERIRSNPELHEQYNARARERYRRLMENPEYREYKNARQREYRRKKAAASSGD